MPRRRRFIFALLGTLLVFVASLGSWLQWSHWPDPKQAMMFADADAIVILGGGDQARWQQGFLMAIAYPEAPVIITGDDGICVENLVGNGVPTSRILHEDAATSTVENAQFTSPLLDKIGAKRVILVTNWFHADRSLAIFRKYQPDRDFIVSFSPKPEPMDHWNIKSERRERLAAIHNLLVHGVWSF